MISKYPWSKYQWFLNKYDAQMSMILAPLSQVVTLVTCCHKWWHLSHVVTLFTCGHTYHRWSYLSYKVTLVTRNQYFNGWPKSAFVVPWRTWPRYRPAWPQVKTKKKNTLIVFSANGKTRRETSWQNLTSIKPVLTQLNQRNKCILLTNRRI